MRAPIGTSGPPLVKAQPPSGRKRRPCGPIAAPRRGYAQARELLELMRQSHDCAPPGAPAAIQPMRAPASEEVDNQIDPNAEERSHGTRQCHDQKGLVDHHTTPHDTTRN